MKCGRYYIELDRTGFPLISRENLDFYIGLFPVSKYQFERFMAERGPFKELYTDEWYRRILKKNPRISWKKTNTNEPWRLFLTGLPYNAISPFLRYLGREYKLPTKTQWLELLKILSELKETKNKFLKCFNSFGEIARPVKLWIEAGLFPLVEEGILEFIEQEFKSDEVACMGKPWQKLWSNTFSAEEVKVVKFEDRAHSIGFRVVKEVR